MIVTRYRREVVSTIEGIRMRQFVGVGQRMKEMTSLAIDVRRHGVIGIVEGNNLAHCCVMIMSKAHMLKRVGNSGHAKLKRQHDEQDHENESAHDDLV